MVVNAQILKSYPGTLDERAEAASIESQICRLAVGLRCLQRVTGALQVVGFACVSLVRHGCCEWSGLEALPSWNKY